MAYNTRPFFKREKMTLIYVIGGTSILMILLLFMCPKTEAMANGVLNIMSGIIGSITTILVQKTHKQNFTENNDINP